MTLCPELDLRAVQEFEGADARADGRRRTVTVAPDRVVIARRVDGVAMRIAIEPHRYTGVLLSVDQLHDDSFGYQVRLIHADADLCVTLALASHEEEARASWRHWSNHLALPRLVESVEGAPELDRGAPTSLLPPTTRRRGSPTLNRRPRFLCRRKVGGAEF
jgi:hypothetical protein